jgi:hypothetical protein
MPSEIIHRKSAAKARFGDPPNSEWHKGIEEGRYPAPDVELGPRTPGWTDGHIERHQAAMRDAATEGRNARAEHGRALRRRPRRERDAKPAVTVENSPTT